MRKKSKLLSLILTLSIIASVLTVSVSAAFSDVSEQDKELHEAVTLLNSLGIAKGTSEYEFGVENDVTREQMAAFIYRMMNKGESLEGGENITSFTDLNDPTFYDMISWADSMDIIKGISATEFNPKGGITLQDCYTMLVRTLGYEKDTSLKYPNDYIDIAEKIGLNKNIQDKAYTEKLRRGDVAVILYNSLYADMNEEETIMKKLYDTEKHILDGKKILFIGNSFTYYGKTVLEKNQKILEQEPRNNDTGYFYQLCKLNGADVSVTNWTWGGHSLIDIMEGNCTSNHSCAGIDHLSYLADRDYDYVVIQSGSADTPESIVDESKNIIKIFREVNPDVKFVYLIHSNYHIKQNADKLAKAKELEEMDVTIVDWGKLVYDIIEGNVTVPNAQEKYNKNSFIICKSATDGFHPNMLSGYITTLMTYCALTGENAIGQPYTFTTDTSVNSAFDTAKFCESYYKYNNPDTEENESITNFPDILNSEADITGIQQLIDKYLEEKAYQKY